MGGHVLLPERPAPERFRAELREAGGAIVGETQEPGDGGAARHTLVAGTRSGGAVTFTRRYDDADRARYPVSYAGTLDAAGDEIAGRLDIPGHWSGTFVMVPAARRAAPATVEVAEAVR